MPWEISFINSDENTPLGSQSYVIDAVAKALPGAQLQAPPSIPDEILQQMPPILREAAVNRTHLEGIFDDGDISIQLYTKNTDPVTFLNAEVRGNGNPFPALSALCAATNWSVWDAANKTVVDVSQPDDSGWQPFSEWRDRAISEVEREE